MIMIIIFPRLRKSSDSKSRNLGDIIFNPPSIRKNLCGQGPQSVRRIIPSEVYPVRERGRSFSSLFSRGQRKIEDQPTEYFLC